MPRLDVHLLGMPRIECAGSLLALERRKALALLAYLALARQAQSRDALAALLWPGYDQTTARGNLRRTLSSLHEALHRAWLVIDRDTVELRRADELWIDVERFSIEGFCSLGIVASKTDVAEVGVGDGKPRIEL